jgi:hypothetical protein
MCANVSRFNDLAFEIRCGVEVNDSGKLGVFSAKGRELRPYWEPLVFHILLVWH